MLAPLYTGARVLILDQRGHGRTTVTSGGFGLDVLAEDVLAVVRALQLEDVTLLGHSMGALVAARAQRLAREIIVGTDLGAITIMPIPSAQKWGAARVDLAADGVDSPQNILTSFDSTGNTVKLVLDLDGQPKLFGDGPFNPVVRVNASKAGPATAAEPTG